MTQLCRRLFCLTARLHSLTANSPNALRAIEAAIRSYVSSESSARDLISTLWNISDRRLEDTASAVNAILDVLEDEEKKRNLLSSWNSFKIEVLHKKTTTRPSYHSFTLRSHRNADNSPTSLLPALERGMRKLHLAVFSTPRTVSRDNPRDKCGIGSLEPPVHLQH